jgi:hypothetical protein
VTRRPGQKPSCDPLTFILLKRYHFDFLKKIDPVTQLKPGIQALDRDSHQTSSENYG